MAIDGDQHAIDGDQHHDPAAPDPGAGSLAAALEREHQEIDAGLEAYAAGGDSAAARQALERAIRALRRHIFLEEEFLFPPLRDAGMVAPVFVMLREHAQIWATLDEVEGELRAGRTGLALCRRLAVELLHHNLKEERILYPQADTALAAPVADHLRGFLQTGELPEGWVCQRYAPKPT